MKSITFKIFSILLLGVLIFSCDKKDKTAFTGVNKLEMTFTDGKDHFDFLLGDKDPQTVNMQLTSTLNNQDLIIDIVPKETDFDQYLELSAKKITISKGNKKATFTIKLKEDANIEKDMTFNLSFRTDNKDVETNNISVTIKPQHKIVLSSKEQELVDKWKKDKNIDVTKIIGDYLCSGTITVSGPDGEDSKVSKIENKPTMISISPLATNDKVILALKQNAFGLNQYFEDVYLNKNIYDKENWLNNNAPEHAKLLKKIGIQIDSDNNVKLNEKFNVAYYTLELQKNNENKIEIVKPILKTIEDILKLPTVDQFQSPEAFTYTGSDESDITYFPLVFDFTIWNKMIEYAKAHESDDPDYKTNLGTMGVSPYQVLYSTNVSKNQWKEEGDNATTPYIPTSISYDDANNSFHVQFSRDSQEDDGYTTIDIVMKKIK